MFRLDEERIQLPIFICAVNNGHESQDGTGYFCDEDIAAFDVLQGKCNGLWMGQKRFTVARIVE